LGLVHRHTGHALPIGADFLADVIKGQLHHATPDNTGPHGTAATSAAPSKNEMANNTDIPCMAFSKFECVLLLFFFDCFI
jgi:hypothetical protein